jgi:alpha-beta hydrolase superfamily lysophospholipase
MGQWKTHPLFVVAAGQDKLADTPYAKEALKKVPGKLLTMVVYDENYHENFNETNREKIYDQIYAWMKPLMK